MRANAPDGDPDPGWWRRPVAQLQDELGAAAGGLTGSEARARLARFGSNTFRDQSERSLAVQFLRRFGNPLVLILIAASIVSALTGEVASFVIIVAMVLASVVLDFVQEYRAGEAARELRAIGADPRIRLARRRAGRRPGDGGRSRRRRAARRRQPRSGRRGAARGARPLRQPVAAHGRIVSGRETRPPYPATRRPSCGPRPTRCSWGRRWSAAPHERSSAARAPPRRSARIAHTLTLDPPPTSFELGTRRFGMLIMRLTVLMVLFVLLVNAAGGKPLLASLLFAIALAVGLTPELMPMVISVTLSRGRPAPRAETGDRQAPGGDPEPGLDGRAVHRQDRHADRGEDQARAPPRRPRRRQRTRAVPRLSQQPVRDRDPQPRSTRPSSRTGIPTPRAGPRSTRCLSTSNAAASRCWSTTAPRACSSSRARPRTSSGCRRTGMRATRTRRRRGMPPRAMPRQQRLAALGAEGLRVLGIAFRHVGRGHTHAVGGRRAATRVRGLRGVSRSAEGERRRGARGAGRRRDRRQDPDRRQRARHAARLPRTAHGRHRRADRRGDRAASTIMRSRPAPTPPTCSAA